MGNKKNPPLEKTFLAEEKTIAEMPLEKIQYENKAALAPI